MTEITVFKPRWLNHLDDLVVLERTTREGRKTYALGRGGRWDFPTTITEIKNLPLNQIKKVVGEYNKFCRIVKRVGKYDIPIEEFLGTYRPEWAVSLMAEEEIAAFFAQL